MIQAGDRRGFEDFSFFEGLIIFFLNQLGTADTVYVLTRRGARAEGLLRAPISKVVLTTTIAEAQTKSQLCRLKHLTLKVL